MNGMISDSSLLALEGVWALQGWAGGAGGISCGSGTHPPFGTACCAMGPRVLCLLFAAEGAARGSAHRRERNVADKWHF